MGTYYIIANQTKKQRVEPGKVGGGSIKASMIFNCGTLLAWLMMTEWAGDLVTITGDTTDFYHDVREEYDDVTKEVVSRFNTRWAGAGFLEPQRKE